MDDLISAIPIVEPHALDQAIMEPIPFFSHTIELLVYEESNIIEKEIKYPHLLNIMKATNTRIVVFKTEDPTLYKFYIHGVEESNIWAKELVTVKLSPHNNLVKLKMIIQSPIDIPTIYQDRRIKKILVTSDHEIKVYGTFPAVQSLFYEIRKQCDIKMRIKLKQNYVPSYLYSCIDLMKDMFHCEISCSSIMDEQGLSIYLTCNHIDDNKAMQCLRYMLIRLSYNIRSTIITIEFGISKALKGMLTYASGYMYLEGSYNVTIVFKNPNMTCISGTYFNVFRAKREMRNLLRTKFSFQLLSDIRLKRELTFLGQADDVNVSFRQRVSSSVLNVLLSSDEEHIESLFRAYEVIHRLYNEWVYLSEGFGEDDDSLLSDEENPPLNRRINNR